MNGEPPPKRRRTSSQGSTSSQSQSRERAGSRTDHTRDGRPQSRRRYSASRSRSRDRRQNRDSPHRRPSFRDHSADYTPRTRSCTPPTRQRSYTRSTSPIPLPTLHKPKLSFTAVFTLPHAHTRGITSAKFSPDHSLLATGSADASINIYAVLSSPSPSTPFKLLRTLRSHKAGINALSWSPVGPPYTLASASDDKSILLWSPLSSDFPIPPSPFMGHSNYVCSLAFSPKGNMLVSGSYDEAVFLWDVRSARIMRQLPAHSDPVCGVDFIRDGTMVCSCASDGLIRIWDSGTGQCLKTLVDEDRKAVSAARFTPNGRFVLAWTLDSCVRLWRYLGDAACVKTYQGHKNSQYSLSGTVGEYEVEVMDEDEEEGGGVERGGRRKEAFVVSGSEDGDVVVWDVNSKEVLWRASQTEKGGHDDVVLSVDWGRCRDGRGLLVSVGKDRELRVWVEEKEPLTIEETNSSRGEMKDIQGHMVKMELKREDTDIDGDES